MTCEEFLMQYRDAMAVVEDLECQIEFAEGRLQRTTANYEGVKVQGHHDRKDAEAELADLVRESLDMERIYGMLREAAWRDE